jgi:predicted transposase/invertase (TIGR01784 family)
MCFLRGEQRQIAGEVEGSLETDSFFYRLFKQLPQTLFDLLGMPPQHSAYRFDSVELKKSWRIDGLFLPKKPDLPLFFVEVRLQPLPTFYANLFAKVFAYLEENDPGHDWMAVAIFSSRRGEPAKLRPYEALLKSAQVKRYYLDDLAMPTNSSPGLALLKLVTAPVDETKTLVKDLLQMERPKQTDSLQRHKVLELVEELLIRRFSQLSREEIRAMFHLEDIRKTRVWQEAHDEGVEKTQSETIHRCLAKGIPVKEIAELLQISVKEVRRLSRITRPA